MTLCIQSGPWRRGHITGSGHMDAASHWDSPMDRVRIKTGMETVEQFGATLKRIHKLGEAVSRHSCTHARLCAKDEGAPWSGSFAGRYR